MILVLGASGFLGKRLVLALEEAGRNVVKSSLSLGVDLRQESEVCTLFDEVKPDFVMNCASFVGGIQWGLRRSADIFDNNIRMIANVYKSAQRVGVKRIVNPISNCVYPARASFFREGEIWDGALHETVEIYGLLRKLSWAGAKAYGKQYGLDTINLVFSNMYGPEDHFEEERSHALGALIMKIVRAKQQGQPEVIIWGTGTPVREWLYVDDAAHAMIKALDLEPTDAFINIGVGKGISVWDMAQKIRQIVGFEGKLTLDPSKPDGAPYKTVDGSKGKSLMKWQPETIFETGLEQTIRWYLNDSALVF